jgi:hypothetical protein
MTTEGTAKSDESQPPPISVAILKNVIKTFKWSPPSPDPAGVAYWPAKGTLLITDSEVEEMAIDEGFNAFEASLNGNLINTFNIKNFTIEPTGVCVNPINGHIFITDDDDNRVFEIYVGKDQLFNTADDVITYIDTLTFGSNDPEGVACWGSELFVADSATAEVYRINPGFNRIFDGIPPHGDDIVSHFDTQVIGVTDLQGIAINYLNNTLFLAGRESDYIFETTKQGEIVRKIDISLINILALSDLSLGESSQNDNGYLSLYIADRGVDNNFDPNENDGKIFEITFNTLKVKNLYLPLINR